MTREQFWNRLLVYSVSADQGPGIGRVAGYCRYLRRCDVANDVKIARDSRPYQPEKEGTPSQASRIRYSPRSLTLWPTIGATTLRDFSSQ